MAVLIAVMSHLQPSLTRHMRSGSTVALLKSFILDAQVLDGDGLEITGSQRASPGGAHAAPDADSVSDEVSMCLLLFDE